MTWMLFTTWMAPSCVFFDNDKGFIDVPECSAEGSVPDGFPCVCDTECSSASCIPETGIDLEGERIAIGPARGYCWRDCKVNDDCDVGYSCALGRCMPRCRNGEECPESRICSTLDSNVRNGVCEPYCGSDDDCSTRNCNPWSRDCLLPDETPQGSDLLERCTENEECKSGLCVANGCYTTCDATVRACPENATCIDRFFEEGMCTYPCEDDSDCTGFAYPFCVEMSGGKFCDFVEPKD